MLQLLEVAGLVELLQIVKQLLSDHRCLHLVFHCGERDHNFLGLLANFLPLASCEHRMHFFVDLESEDSIIRINIFFPLHALFLSVIWLCSTWYI